MEEDVALLFADLSGYTALTETHGAATAADLVDKFISIVDECLVGDCHLHTRVGDEVVFLSSSPDHLISTAVMLLQKCSESNYFLQLHGGLHYGKLLKRNDNYFGTAINLTSRIANKANPGTFWCSEAYINALHSNSAVEFQSRGKHNFKNLNDSCEVFELIMDNPGTFHIDPVCRMLISEKLNAIQYPGNPAIYFCSEHCLGIYKKLQTG